ncbi:MAG: glutaredoxin family protein [Candidatus Nanoarchaeia archaeon]
MAKQIKRIRLFTTPYCPYCKLAEDFFIKNGITFEKVDVSENEEALNEMVQLSGQMGVPVIQIDGNVLVGFNEQKLKKLLGGK